MTNHFIDYQNSDVFLCIGANTAENHPMSMKWITRARENKGAKLIVVDPRLSKTASLADIHASIRPGTDIAFVNGIMNYATQNNLYQHDYVVNYTNASYLVDPGYGFNDGMFSGFAEGKYDNKTWQYQKDGESIKKDPTLQNPNCVFQILKRHMSRYDLKTVCQITGTPEAVYQKVCETYCSTGKAGKAGNVIYAMGITQSSHGGQNVRSVAMLQLLLGNMGIAGGGVNAQRGESNVQGSTDMGMLYHYVPGYINNPAAPKHPTLKDYLAVETPKTGYWSNKPKFLISMLKAWYGDKATAANDFCFDWMPKHTGKDHSHMSIFDSMLQSKIKGFFVWGQNPAVGGPNSSMERSALANLDWMVAVDMVETETASFWKAPGVNAADIKTEVFLLPAAASYEKEGTVANSGRWIQWRYKAIDPPGDAESDLWIADRIFKAIREVYRSDANAVFPDAIFNMVWNYDKAGSEEPDIEKVAIEINGYTVADSLPVKNFTKLMDDGSTACGCWVFSGYYNDPAKPACKSRIREKEGIGLHPQWSFAWPVNRRIVYNRCSCDAGGKPWNEQLALVKWDGTKWVNNDVPDFGWKKADSEEMIPPDTSAKTPFIMIPEGQGYLFAPPMKDGPLPEHYEPVESPVQNLMSKTQSNPLVKKYQSEFGKVAATGSADYPYILTTHRVVEHYQSGALTRNSPYLVEIMPEMFVEISPQLASQLGIKSGEDVEISTIRAKIVCKVCVTPILKPMQLKGKVCEVVAMPWHWGYQGLASGSSANDLTPCVGDPSTNIPEYKACLCNLRKVH